MKNNVQYYRNKAHLTQAELAEKSGLSLRTVQRIEAGSMPAGYSLQSLAGALSVAMNDLVPDRPTMEKPVDIKGMKLINLSAIAFIFVPFGNIIFPLLLIHRSSEPSTKAVGKNILSVQIVWTVVTSLLLIVSPSLQVWLNLTIPLIFVVMFILFLLNAIIIFKNAVALERTGELSIRLGISLL